jgi:hypothetical protein
VPYQDARFGLLKPPSLACYTDGDDDMAEYGLIRRASADLE